MGRAFGFLTLIVVVAVGAYIYMRQTQGVMAAGTSSPTATVDLIGVRNDLLAIAQAERSHAAIAGRRMSPSKLLRRRANLRWSATTVDLTTIPPRSAIPLFALWPPIPARKIPACRRPSALTRPCRSASNNHAARLGCSSSAAPCFRSATRLSFKLLDGNKWDGRRHEISY